MYQTINFSQFCDSFSDTYKGNFSYEGKKALFEYLEQLETDTGEPIELDPIALCCDYTEYEDFAEYQSQLYDKIKSLDELKDHTTVIEIDGKDSFIIQNY